LCWQHEGDFVFDEPSLVGLRPEPARAVSAIRRPSTIARRIAMSLTHDQRENLAKLASYLEQLPPDYEHFEMGGWIGAAPDNVILNYALHNGGVAQCGTVACAVGHGPAAGILVPEHMIYSIGPRMRVSWWPYSRLFVSVPRYFDWLFSAKWGVVDNTPHGAAARIRYVLDRGTPPDEFKSVDDVRPSDLDLYAPYRIDAKARADA
jgi:hypothetical protein